jgi:hypothetical protein
MFPHQLILTGNSPDAQIKDSPPARHHTHPARLNELLVKFPQAVYREVGLDMP